MLQEWRKRNKVTLAEVAAQCETSEASISRIERGEQTPSLALAVKLENLTEIPAREFLPKDAQP